MPGAFAWDEEEQTEHFRPSEDFVDEGQSRRDLDDQAVDLVKKKKDKKGKSKKRTEDNVGPELSTERNLPDHGPIPAIAPAVTAEHDADRIVRERPLSPESMPNTSRERRRRRRSPVSWNGEEPPDLTWVKRPNTTCRPRPNDGYCIVGSSRPRIDGIRHGQRCGNI